MSLTPELAITLDIDWSPDFAIDFTAELLLEKGVRATWFITHQSPAIERLRQHRDCFELGIHPNFLPGSTHGDTADEVLAHCLRIVPEAESMRTHALVQSTSLLAKVLSHTRIAVDVSLFLPWTPNISPVKYSLGGRPLIRIPYVWEDSYEILQKRPCWELGKLTAPGHGIKIINFHPIHVYLNSADPSGYLRVKGATPLSELSRAQAAPHVHVGKGSQTLFREAIDFLSHRGASQRICDLARTFDLGGTD